MGEFSGNLSISGSAFPRAQGEREPRETRESKRMGNVGREREKEVAGELKVQGSSPAKNVSSPFPNGLDFT